MILMLGVGYFFLRRNKSTDDYYVGGRNMGSWHVGLSVVATDVGGGFSIGLGGLGFTMGLSGSWMLFTGLIGAWMAASWLIPRVYDLAREKQMLTFPQLFGHFYSARVALAAGIISAIGYVGFTSSQLLAGAKLAAASFEGLNLNVALLIMGIIAVVYTVMGGIKAVIYTDTIQWIILLSGLIFIGLPLGYIEIGGYEAIKNTVAPEMLKLNNITWVTLLNWAITIIPIWFVGMTLYQRIYSCRGPKEARKAWYIAGVFEWPIMAFMGVTLGLFARVGADAGMFAYMGFEAVSEMDPEMGLPLLLRTVLPVGLMGLMMAAYFSAIMSTADSCLMAASGNLLTDVFKKPMEQLAKIIGNLRVSQFLTLLIGILALLLALTTENVLDLMLESYAFMVSGLFIPVVAMLFTKKPDSRAALVSMIGGGGTTLLLIFSGKALPLGLDPIFYGIIMALACYFGMYWIFKKL